MIKFYTIIFCIITSITYAQVPKNGLVGYWKFDNNLKDSSGLKHDGIASRKPGYSSDRFGIANATYLTDSGYVHVPFSNDFNFSTAAKDTFSISLWVYYPGKFGYYGSVFVKEKTGFLTPNGSGKYGFSFSDYPGYFLNPKQSDAVLNFEANKWYHLVAVYAGNTFKSYLNNKLDKSTFGEIIAGEEGIVIGKMSSFNRGGKVDDIAIYKRALSLKEIDEIHNYTPPVTAALKMDVEAKRSYIRLVENSTDYEVVSTNEISDMRVVDALGKTYNVVNGTKISGLVNGFYIVFVESTSGKQKIKLQVLSNL